jgi:hypothetical protein
LYPHIVAFYESREGQVKNEGNALSTRSFEYTNTELITNKQTRVREELTYLTGSGIPLVYRSFDDGELTHMIQVVSLHIGDDMQRTFGSSMPPVPIPLPLAR